MHARRRRIQRLVAQALMDIDTTEAYLADRSRKELAQDFLRRDAAEQSLTRVAAALRVLHDLDGSAGEAMGAFVTVLDGVQNSRAVARMDVDVLAGLMTLCCHSLRPCLKEMRRSGRQRT